MYLMKWEQIRDYKLMREQFQNMLIAAHPENTDKIIRVFRQEEEREQGIEPESVFIDEDEEGFEIEGFDITDIIEQITTKGFGLSED